MSGIAGILNRDGCEAGRDILTGIMDATRYRGPDSCAHQVFGPAGLCQLLMATTPEAEDETQPFFHSASSTAIVFDGRVDNRDDLIPQLEAHGHNRRTNTDMEIVLLCWLVWGAECAGRILGDFAFAIWDGPRQRMFCARDAAGVRPLHYFVDENVFIFATDICQILSHPAVIPRPNEGMIGEILCVAFINEEETLYTDIFRLRPAHHLLINAKRMEVRRFWNPADSPPIRYRTGMEYADHFQDIFRESVKCRLRCNGPLGASLSGGFDSSLVVGMAQSLLNKENLRSRINTYSITLPDHPFDELPRIEAMVRKWGLSADYLHFQTFDKTPGWIEQARLFRDLPAFPTLSVMGVLQRSAAASGNRVMLSGDGADTWLGGTDYPYLGMLLDGKWAGLVKELRYQFGEDWHRALRFLARSVCWPLLPRGVKSQLESRVVRKFHYDFLPGTYQKQIRLQQRLNIYNCTEEFKDLARWSTCFNTLLAGSAFHHEMEDRTNACNGVEERHPFLDKRLITFACGIPDYLKHRQAVRKLLVRQTGKQFWPALMYDAPAQADYFRLLVEAIRLEPVREAMDRLSISGQGWVSKNRVQGVYNGLMESIETSRDLSNTEYRVIAPLWVTFAVEAWYHQNFGEFE